MYTLSILVPVVISACAYNFIENQGDFCFRSTTEPSVIKYYEAGKSCYVNGTFYSKCEERLNGPV